MRASWLPPPQYEQGSLGVWRLPVFLGLDCPLPFPLLEERGPFPLPLFVELDRVLGRWFELRPRPVPLLDLPFPFSPLGRRKVVELLVSGYPGGVLCTQYRSTGHSTHFVFAPTEEIV